MQPALFTLDEARRALPLVSRIAGDIQSTVRDLSQITGGVSLLIGVIELDDIAGESKREVRKLLYHFSDLESELREIGVVLKGYDPVLIDFRWLRGGREVYLCWEIGEEDVTHWHTLQEGYTCRQEL